MVLSKMLFKVETSENNNFAALCKINAVNISLLTDY